MRYLLSVMVAAMLAANAIGSEFRCESEIFLASEKKPVQESLTIFAETVIYDFVLTRPEEITVYDVSHGRITLLDKSRKVKTTIATDDLLRFTAAYKTAKPESELFTFCVQPTFTQTEEEGQLVLQGKPLTYRVTPTQPKVAGAEKRYREFADWSARLNAMRPGNLPPFARMELNQALVNAGQLPEEVERSISTVHLTGKRTEVIRSRHLFNWQLSTQDARRIETAGEYLSGTAFSNVALEDYLQLNPMGEKTAARSK